MSRSGRNNRSSPQRDRIGNTATPSDSSKWIVRQDGNDSIRLARENRQKSSQAPNESHSQPGHTEAWILPSSESRMSFGSSISPIAANSRKGETAQQLIISEFDTPNLTESAVSKKEGSKLIQAEPCRNEGRSNNQKERDQRTKQTLVALRKVKFSESIRRCTIDMEGLKKTLQLQCLVAKGRLSELVTTKAEWMRRIKQTRTIELSTSSTTILEAPKTELPTIPSFSEERLQQDRSNIVRLQQQLSALLDKKSHLERSIEAKEYALAEAIRSNLEGTTNCTAGEQIIGRLRLQLAQLTEDLHDELSKQQVQQCPGRSQSKNCELQHSSIQSKIREPRQEVTSSRMGCLASVVLLTMAGLVVTICLLQYL